MREEVREFKRARIVDQAAASFYRNGYEATSIDQLASELNVTKPFIYNYFPTKLAILEAVYQRSSERLVDNLRKELEVAGPPGERLRKFIRMYVLENITHQSSSGVFLQEEKRLSPEHLTRIRAIEHAFNDALTELIQEGIDTGKFRIESAGLASLGISGMVRWVHRWYKPAGRLSPDEIATQMAELGLNMVRGR
jgi:TetR/AcrR family transcriptional regulator, cholesterol catabolism regulator